MKLQRALDRMMPSAWRLVIVFLVPAMLITPEMQAQEKPHEFSLFNRPKPVVKIVSSETRQVRQGQGGAVTVEFTVNQKVFGTNPADVRIAPVRAILQTQNGIFPSDDVTWQHKLGDRWVRAVPTEQFEPGEWRALIPYAVASDAAKGGRELRGTLEFVPVTGQTDFSTKSISFKTSAHIDGPYHDPSKWNLLWQVPAMAPLLPVFVLALPFILIFVLSCEVSHEECA